MSNLRDLTECIDRLIESGAYGDPETFEVFIKNQCKRVRNAHWKSQKIKSKEKKDKSKDKAKPKETISGQSSKSKIKGKGTDPVSKVFETFGNAYGVETDWTKVTSGLKEVNDYNLKIHALIQAKVQDLCKDDMLPGVLQQIVQDYLNKMQTTAPVAPQQTKSYLERKVRSKAYESLMDSLSFTSLEVRVAQQFIPHITMKNMNEVGQIDVTCIVDDVMVKTITDNPSMELDSLVAKILNEKSVNNAKASYMKDKQTRKCKTLRFKSKTLKSDKTGKLKQYKLVYTDEVKMPIPTSVDYKIGEDVTTFESSQEEDCEVGEKYNEIDGPSFNQSVTEGRNPVEVKSFQKTLQLG